MPGILTPDAHILSVCSVLPMPICVQVSWSCSNHAAACMHASPDSPCMQISQRQCGDCKLQSCETPCSCTGQAWNMAGMCRKRCPSLLAFCTLNRPHAAAVITLGMLVADSCSAHARDEQPEAKPSRSEWKETQEQQTRRGKSQSTPALHPAFHLLWVQTLTQRPTCQSRGGQSQPPWPATPHLHSQAPPECTASSAARSCSPAAV